MTYQIALTPIALKALEAISDRRIREQIRDRINGLARDPELQGKPLGGELAGLRSLRAAAQRYRILYRVERSRILVIVLTVGLRRAGDRTDVYRLAKKLIRLRLI